MVTTRELALVWSVTGVHVHMVFQVLLKCKLLAADPAFELALGLMGVHVPPQAIFVDIDLVAAFMGAFEGGFRRSCVVRTL